MSPDLSRIDRLWQCTRCGYFPYSMPCEDALDEAGRDIGTILHRCPTCGDTDWHWCGGDDRETRIGYAKKLDPPAGEIVNNCLDPDDYPEAFGAGGKPNVSEKTCETCGGKGEIDLGPQGAYSFPGERYLNCPDCSQAGGKP